MPKLFATLMNHAPGLPYSYRGSDVPCNLCGSGDRILICDTDRRLKRLHTVACSQCGLIRTDPMPSEQELEDYYANDYRWDYQFSLQRTPPKFHLNRSHREAQRRLESLEPMLKPRSRVLDFGSGSGEFLAHAARAGHVVRGLEPGNDFAEFSRREHGVQVDCVTWQRAEFAEKSFDLITANHVLEHLREPVSALKRLAGWLADDGILHVSVPNALARRRYSFMNFHFAHVYGFTPQTLLWAGSVAGLKPDVRYAMSGTTVVFRKSADGPSTPAWGEARGREIAAHFPRSSVASFLLSGGWCIDTARRLTKVLAHSVGTETRR